MLLAYIGLGSNLGKRKTNLESSIDRLDKTEKILVTKISSFFETKPVGGPPQPNFLNSALEIKTSLLPRILLIKLQRIENSLGRKRMVKWGPRTIDMDILLFENTIINDHNLIIPHPLMHTRKFVLDPLSKIAPDFKHPIFNKTIMELKNALEIKRC